MLKFEKNTFFTLQFSNETFLSANRSVVHVFLICFFTEAEYQLKSPCQSLDVSKYMYV